LANATGITELLYAECYPDRRHLNPQQVINIERRSCQNPRHQQRQKNRNINNNDQRFITFSYSSFKSAC